MLRVDAVRFSPAGKLAVALSDMTSKVWTGAVGIFESAETAPALKHSLTAEPTDFGITDIAWLDERRLASVSDSGALSLHTWHGGSENSLETEHVFAEHDDSLLTLAVSNDNASALTAGFDGSIKLWDLSNPENEYAVNTFVGHTGNITKVAWALKSSKAFASASEDGTVKVWDTAKKTHTASVSFPCGVFSLAWVPESEGLLAVGLEDGSISFVDATSGVVAKSFKAHANRVAVLEFSPLQPSLLASGGDDDRVVVTNTKTWDAVYTSERHRDYVRALAWHPRDPALLVSGSWDKKVLQHVIKM